MRHLIIVFLSAFLVSCGGVMATSERLGGKQQKDLEHYLETANHLSEKQRQAMKEGRPFIGMTHEEANLSMIAGERQDKLDGKLLRGQFRNRAGQKYMLAFDCGSPNRVESWSAFTDAEVRELGKFRDVRPCPPIPQLRRR